MLITRNMLNSIPLLAQDARYPESYLIISRTFIRAGWDRNSCMVSQVTRTMVKNHFQPFKQHSHASVAYKQLNSNLNTTQELSTLQGFDWNRSSVDCFKVGERTATIKWKYWRKLSSFKNVMHGYKSIILVSREYNNAKVGCLSTSMILNEKSRIDARHSFLV